MPVADRRHALDVVDRLLHAGHEDPDLLAAALLHDAAKGHRMRLWHRVAGVLMEAAAPPAMQRADPMPPRAGSDRVSEVHSEPPAQTPTPTPQPAPAAPAGPADTLAATLESLAGLRDKGLITAEEYEAKKRELLERM
jgi:hypothetical protein